MPGLMGIVRNDRVDEQLLDKMANSIKRDARRGVGKDTA